MQTSILKMVHSQKIIWLWKNTGYCPLPKVVVHQLTWGHPPKLKEERTENAFLFKGIYVWSLKPGKFSVHMKKLQGDLQPLQQNLKVQNPKGFFPSLPKKRQDSFTLTPPPLPRPYTGSQRIRLLPRQMESNREIPGRVWLKKLRKKETCSWVRHPLVSGILVNIKHLGVYTKKKSVNLLVSHPRVWWTRCSQVSKYGEMFLGSADFLTSRS